MINLQKFQFQNEDATGNLIRYITRTRSDEDRLHELVSYGFASGNIYLKPIDEVIHEFEHIQKSYHAAGCLMCHYIVLISNTIYEYMNNDLGKLNAFAAACCKYLYDLGHQAMYAIHYSEKGQLHIHLAINAVNYMNGHKLRQYPKEIRKTVEQPLNNLLQGYICKTVDSIHELE